MLIAFVFLYVSNYANYPIKTTCYDLIPSANTDVSAWLTFNPTHCLTSESFGFPLLARCSLLSTPLPLRPMPLLSTSLRSAALHTPSPSTQLSNQKFGLSNIAATWTIPCSLLPALFLLVPFAFHFFSYSAIPRHPACSCCPSLIQLKSVISCTCWLLPDSNCLDPIQSVLSVPSARGPCLACVCSVIDMPLQPQGQTEGQTEEHRQQQGLRLRQLWPHTPWNISPMPRRACHKRRLQHGIRICIFICICICGCATATVFVSVSV